MSLSRKGIWRYRSLSVLPVACAAVIGVSHVHAVPVSLTASDPGGSTSFNTGLNWSNLAAPSAGNTYFTGAFQLRSTTSGTPTFAGDSLSIDAGGSFLLKSPGAHTINNLIMNGGTIFHGDVGVAAQVGTVAGNINMATASSFVSGPNIGATPRNLTINSILSGAGNLTVNTSVGDIGIVVLNGNNSTYSGVTTVNAGTLRVRNNNALGTTGAANTILNILGTAATGGNGTSVQFENNVTVAESFQLNTGAGDRRNSLISNSGTTTLTGPINISGGSTVNLTVSAGTFNVNGNITQSGWTGGTLFLRGGGGTGNMNGIIDIGARDLAKTDANTWIINSTGNNWNNTTIAVGTLQLGINNALDIDGSVTMGQADANSPLLRLNGFQQTIAGLTRNGSNTGASTRVAGGSATESVLTINNSANFSYSGLIGGTGTNENNLRLVKLGDGTQTLTGANTFTGAVSVQDGILNIRNSTALGAAAKTVTIAGNAAGLLTPELQLQDNISVAMTTLNVSGNGVSGNGVLHNISGNNTITATNIVLVGGNGGSEFQSDAGLLTLNGNISANTTLRTLALDGAGNGLVNGDIANGSTVNLPLTKNGTGTWTLAGNNTYTGNTTINNGVLALASTGSIDNSSVINVASLGTFDVSAVSGYDLVSGQSLIGNGTIIGDVVTDDGSIISPGATPGAIGTLTFLDDLDINGTLLIDINGTGAGSSDLINVAGLLDIGGATLDFDLVNIDNDPFYIFASYGSLTGQFSSITGMPVSGYEVKYNFQGNNIALVSIPEPATISLLALGSLGLLRRRRVVG